MVAPVHVVFGHQQVAEGRGERPLAKRWHASVSRSPRPVVAYRHRAGISPRSPRLDALACAQAEPSHRAAATSLVWGGAGRPPIPVARSSQPAQTQHPNRSKPRQARSLMTSPRIRHEGTPTSPRHSADLSQSSTSPQSIGARSRTAAAANCATPRANPSRAPPTTQPSPSTAARRASVRRARSSRSEPSHEH